MYNQMLIPSPLSPLLFNPSSSSALSFSSPRSAAAAPSSPLSHLHCFQVVEKVPGMEALRSSLRPETVSSPQQQNHEVVAWEKAGLPGEVFSIDELLNLGEFEENEKESEDNDEEQEAETEEVSGEHEGEEVGTVEDCCTTNVASSSPPSSSSALSYEGSRPLSEITLPAHDADEFEWVSLFMDDSLTEFPTGVAPFASPPQAQNRSDNGQQHHGAVVGPAHVASLPCAAVCAVSSEAPVPPKAKRSKRSRTIGIGWSTALPFTDFSSTTTTTSASSCSSSSSSSLSPCLIYDHSAATDEQSFLLYESHPSLAPSPSPPPHPASKKTKLPKKRGRKPKQPPAASGSVVASPHGERRCSHCGAQKTPQWRAGPKGAKTLCNACGVRYKSGRLLPEYRPACSPTYVDSIHSSSHRKVLELRRQKEAELLHAIGPQPVATC